MTGGGAVAETIGVVAEERAALGNPETSKRVKDVYFFGDWLAAGKEVGFGLGDRLFEGWASGVFNGILGKGLVVVRAIDVGANFPDVAGHVVESKVVGGITFYSG